MLPELVVIV